MAVDLYDLVPNIEAALSIPGSASQYANATDDEWVGKLKNAFWHATLDQVITGYTSDEDGMVTPIDAGGDDLSFELQYLVVLYACMDIVKNQLMQMKTVFRAKAGPVEYETQQSAQVLKGLLDAYMKERDLILANLASTNMVSSYYIDTLRARDYAIADGITDWVAS